MLNMLDEDANVCQTTDGLVPDEYLGLHRFKRAGIDGARELLIKSLKDQGLLIPYISTTKKGERVEHDAEPRQIATPFGDRGGVIIEPWLTDQWYVNAEELAKEPLKAVREGTIEIVPKTWEKTFFKWMENIQPWCVSRQLWGDTVSRPAGRNGECYVAMTEQEAQTQAGKDTILRQDTDVLDTWFVSTMAVRNTRPAHKRCKTVRKHYPNDL